MVNSTTCQENIIPLWPSNVPNQIISKESEIRHQTEILWIENVQNPSLEVFLPSKSLTTRQGIVICPGGGYAGLAYDWEGTDIAKWLNTKGIAAFVLKYRLPTSNSLLSRHEAPLQDAQRAMRLVRHHAETWNLSPTQIGILGFSAGGHLASSLATHGTEYDNFVTDEIDNMSAEPDFLALIYPVITMDKRYTHMGSREILLGKNPSEDQVLCYSNELHVNFKTPPTFLVHATDDKSVSVNNSILFYQALQQKGVYSEMHIYPYGGHGFSLAHGKDYLASWPDRLFDWLMNLNNQSV